MINNLVVLYTVDTPVKIGQCVAPETPLDNTALSVISMNLGVNFVGKTLVQPEYFNHHNQQINCYVFSSLLPFFHG